MSGSVEVRLLKSASSYFQRDLVSMLLFWKRLGCLFRASEIPKSSKESRFHTQGFDGSESKARSMSDLLTFEYQCIWE